jgi:hypothetical protein
MESGLAIPSTHGSRAFHGGDRCMLRPANLDPARTPWRSAQAREAVVGSQVNALKRDPTHAVLARVGDLTVGIRAVPDSPPSEERSAADALNEVGRWEGETHEELVALFAGVRRHTSRCVPDLDR